MKPPKINRWVLSSHALTRIEERHVTAAELAKMIENPDITIEQGPKWIFAKHFSHRKDNCIAAVLLEREDENLWVIVTVMVHFQKK